MPSRPVSRSLRNLESRGYECAIAEKYVSQAKRRIDLFGFIDIVAIQPGEILAVQTTGSGNLSKRRTKILGSSNAHLWLEAGGKIELHEAAKRQKKLMSRPSIRKAKRLRNEGATYAELAEMYDVSEGTVRKAIREGDLPTNETWELRIEELTLEDFG